jgi:hypothetical protein
MLLFADEVCLGQPSPEIRVDLAESAQAKDMQVIAGREGLDSAKTRVRKSSREHDMSVQPLLPWCHLRERHPDLKGDAGLFRQDPNWSDGSNRCHDVIEKCPNLRRLSPKMIGQMIAAAGVRLIPIREFTSALLATPQCGPRPRWSISRILDPAAPL